MSVFIKNPSAETKTLVGVDIAPGEIYLIPTTDITAWQNDTGVLHSIIHGDVIVNNGTIDILNKSQALSWLSGNRTPMSEVGTKLWVHNSSKPEFPGKHFYIQWTGNGGDDCINHIINKGLPMHFHMTPGTPSVTIDMEFDPLFGQVYIHEGYVNVSNSSHGDTCSLSAWAKPSLLQQAVNLDLIVENNQVKYSTSGPGTGTHGFAATPNLIPRLYEKDGFWDYSAETGLLPNMSGTGMYQISNVETELQRFVNEVQLVGTTSEYIRLVCEDCFEVPQGYFIRAVMNNNSNSEWYANVMVALYREKTY